MLNGWKAIAAYLGREERTAMRWAADRGLPVHRAPGRGRGSVYALPAEIDGWLLTSRAPAAEAVDMAVVASPLRRPAPRWLWPALVLAAVLLVGVGSVMLRATRPPADASYAFGDPAAKAAYLQATYDWNQRTSESLGRAVSEYGEAIERDPRAAPAYAGLANSYLLLREFGSMPEGEAYPRAKAAAEAAATLSPRAAGPHRALAFVAFWWDQDRAVARREFARALALDPNDPLTHHWFATALSANGEPAAALREIARARELNPGDTAILADQGWIQYVAGQRAAAMTTLFDLARNQPQAVGPHQALAVIALFERRDADYLRESIARARLRGDRSTEGRMAALRTGVDASVPIADAMLREARATASHSGKGWIDVANLAALAGSGQEADTALARGCRAREAGTIATSGALLLSHAVPLARVRALCGWGSLDS